MEGMTTMGDDGSKDSQADQHNTVRNEDKEEQEKEGEEKEREREMEEEQPEERLLYDFYICFNEAIEKDKLVAYDIEDILEAIGLESASANVHPGKTVITNMANGIQHSDKIFVVLSQASKESGSFNYEVDLSLQRCIDRDEWPSRIVPIYVDISRQESLFALRTIVGITYKSDDRQFRKKVCNVFGDRPALRGSNAESCCDVTSLSSLSSCSPGPDSCPSSKFDYTNCSCQGACNSSHPCKIVTLEILKDKDRQPTEECRTSVSRSADMESNGKRPSEQTDVSGPNDIGQCLNNHDVTHDDCARCQRHARGISRVDCQKESNAFFKRRHLSPFGRQASTCPKHRGRAEVLENDLDMDDQGDLGSTGRTPTCSFRRLIISHWKDFKTKIKRK